MAVSSGISVEPGALGALRATSGDAIGGTGTVTSAAGTRVAAGDANGSETEASTANGRTRIGQQLLEELLQRHAEYFADNFRRRGEQQQRDEANRRHATTAEVRQTDDAELAAHSRPELISGHTGESQTQQLRASNV
jgi:hypothetical protein